MADLSQTQSFTPANLISEPVVRRTAQTKGTTPLGMLELADTARAYTNLAKEQALLQPAIEQGIAQSQRAQTEAQQSKFTLGKDQQQWMALMAGGLRNDPDVINGNTEGILKKTEAIRKFADVLQIPKHPDDTLGQIDALAKKDATSVAGFLDSRMQGNLSAANQQALQTPSLTTNAAGELIAANPVTKKITTLGTTPTANVNPTTADVANFNDYQQGLTKRVLASNNYLQRSDELKQLMNEFKPGAGTQTYANIAAKLQAIGAPQGLVDSIAKGDLGAVQSFNKFLAQSVIAGVQQASGGNPTRVAEVENYLKNNPTVNTDPRALQRFIDFTDKLASRDIFENDTLAAAKKTGQFNPATWVSDYQKFATSQGVLPKAVNPEGNVSGDHKEKPAAKEKGNAIYGKYKGHDVVSFDGGKSWDYK